MRNLQHRTLFALLPAGLVALAWACSSSPAPSSAGNDGGSTAEAGGDSSTGPDVLDDFGPGPDGTTSNCTLGDGMTDPVALCLQQQILTEELQYAYAKGQGVAPGWSSTAPYTAMPRTATSWQDDLALAGAMGAFYCSAEVYGNNQSNATLAVDLNDLGKVLVPELQQALLTGYDGEVYFRLRWAQAAYNYASDSVAATLQGMANAYATSIAGQVYAVPAGGGDAGSAGGMVIGVKNADGSVTYSPAQAVMAAAALLDMAVLEATGADAGAASPAWAGIAQQVLAYVLARGRDPVSGLFYQSLVTSGDPGHDTVGAGLPTNDSMLSETQAWVTLGLARAQELLAAFEMTPSADAGSEAGADAGLPVGPVYYQATIALAAAIATDGLFDGTTMPPPAPAVQPVGALLEGVILSGQQLLTDKTTIGNAIYLGGLHRVAVGAGVAQSYELGQIRSALGGVPPGHIQLVHTSLLTIVTDANGDLLQQAYLRAGSKAFGYAAVYAPGSEPVEQGQEPGATNYRVDANHAMIEGITQLWHGAASDARCAP
jgi:hypothetical protein